MQYPSELKVSLLTTSSDLLQITNHTLITLYLITVSVICSFAHLHTTRSVSCKSYLIFIFILFFVIGCFMSTMYNLLHIPLCTVMLILIFNSTAYRHAHSFIFYILFFISYLSFILSYVYFPCVVFFNICTVHGADPTLISLLVIQSLYSRVCDK